MVHGADGAFRDGRGAAYRRAIGSHTRPRPLRTTGTPTHVVPTRVTARSRGAVMSDEAAEARRALQESLDRRDSGE
ncbi:hypothetical protein IGS73_04645 [Janibacter indicus]|uniref:Uncharacterized protein n=1 Tax=Janibacter indicus TaxID=857417 RepID=A0A7L9J307_9MICO|nr:hypothetical protein [Janibacter indicus]QOK23689.1 hypothetical protein IGS73_04645 [Janibacter indicus]